MPGVVSKATKKQAAKNAYRRSKKKAKRDVRLILDPNVITGASFVRGAGNAVSYAEAIGISDPLLTNSPWLSPSASEAHAKLTAATTVISIRLLT
jgi:hypothetical protein